MSKIISPLRGSFGDINQFHFYKNATPSGFYLEANRHRYQILNSIKPRRGEMIIEKNNKKIPLNSEWVK